MSARPDFKSIASFGEFSEYYWYRAELAEKRYARIHRGSGRRQRCGRKSGIRAGKRSTHAGSRTRAGRCFHSIQGRTTEQGGGNDKRPQ